MSHLERNLLALEPDTRWVTDVTKIPTQEGRRSLYVVLDLFRELIVGWFASSPAGSRHGDQSR
jgi:putative transposase